MTKQKFSERLTSSSVSYQPVTHDRKGREGEGKGIRESDLLVLGSWFLPKPSYETYRASAIGIGATR